MAGARAKLELEACAVDLDAGRVLRSGEVLRLTDREQALLIYLSERPGEVISKDRLLEEVWGYARAVVTRAVDATAHRLRAKIERDATDPDHLLTVWGHGYRFEPRRAAVAAPSPPVDLDLFVGREAQEALVPELLARSRLVSLVGPAGIGKTRLAMRIAASQPRTWCCMAESATDADTLDRLVAVAVGADASDLVGGLAALGPGLLVLDNLEQVVAAAAERLATWLRAAPELTVLATSRARLDIAGEQVVVLDPLAAEDAVALLADRVGPDLSLDPQVARSIVDRVDRLPLGIELAAGLAAVLEPAEILARLERPLEALVSWRRDAPARHSSLRAALQGSWDLLDEDHRELLLCLALFRGSFTAEAAGQIVGADALVELRGLRARSLVHPSPSGLRLLETVRAFAAEQSWPGRAEAQQRFVRYFVRRAEELVPLGRPPSSDALNALSDASADLRVALSLATSADDGLSLANALHQVLGWRGPLRLALGAVEDALAMQPPGPSLARAYLLRHLGHLHLRGGDVPAAVSVGEAAHAIARELGSDDQVGRALVLLGNCALRQSDPERGVRLHEEALELLEAAGDVAYAASAYGNLGTAYTHLDRLGPAHQAYARARELHIEVGNPRGAALALGNMGRLDAVTGRLDDARARLSAALLQHRAVSDQVDEALCAAHLGNLALVEGDPLESISWFESSLAAMADGGSRELRGLISNRLAIACCLAGQAEAALEALAGSAQVLGGATPPTALASAALVYAMAGRPHEARAALVVCPSPVGTGETALHLVVEAALARARGDTDDAALVRARQYTEASTRAEERYELLPLLQALESSASGTTG